MLAKNTLTRLSNISQIKAHQWFQNFSWDSLICLDIQPPYVPKHKNFDVDFTIHPYINYIIFYTYPIHQ